jgi:chromosome segregation ATPase
LKIPILFGSVIALAAANVYLFTQIDSLKTQLAKNQESFVTEIGQVRQSSAANVQAARRNMESLKDELETARRQASMAVGQAKVDATKHADELAKRLEQQQKATTAATEALKSDLSKVEQVATTATTQIGEVNKEVSNVKSEVASNKSELDKTISDLKSTRGDLGVQSGLIATNSKELAALRALGERNYFEFSLGKSKTPQRVGDIMVQLKKTDNKRNKYTVELIADDKKVEKKDKGLNEPVQFYTSKARQPYEMVVNEVGKDTIKGYLATPKVTNARN